MADETASRPPTKKEAEVLTDSSLLLLANGVAKQDLKGLELAMYLNIPTATIIKCIGEETETALTAEGSESARMAVAAKCVLMWKEMTKECKTKERIKGLERALREIGKPDVADMFLERHSNNQELSSDIFA